MKKDKNELAAAIASINSQNEAIKEIKTKGKSPEAVLNQIRNSTSTRP